MENIKYAHAMITICKAEEAGKVPKTHTRKIAYDKDYDIYTGVAMAMGWRDKSVNPLWYLSTRKVVKIEKMEE